MTTAPSRRGPGAALRPWLLALALVLPGGTPGRAQSEGGATAIIPDVATPAPAPSPAAAGTSLEVRGNGPTPRRLDADELRRLPRAEVRTADHREPGKEIAYAGVPLVEVLRAAGLTLDPGMAGIRQTVAASVLVEGADGYRAVFALAELDPALTDRVILLADTRDDQPLGAGEGPLRLVVPGDKRPARAVRQVVAVTLRRE